MNDALLVICIILGCLFVVSLVMIYHEHQMRMRSEDILDHMIASMMEVIKEDITEDEDFEDEEGHKIKSLKIGSIKKKKDL